MVIVKGTPNAKVMSKRLQHIITYIQQRKFRPYHSSKNIGKVFSYQLDPKLHLYMYYHFDECELVYDDDFTEKLYSGSPFDDEFPIVLDQALFERYNDN